MNSLTMVIDLKGTGCFCVLHHVETGGAVQAFGDVPSALIGAKWADVREWSVLLWHRGLCHIARVKSESREPPELENLINHMERHPSVWRRLELAKPVLP